MDLRHLTDKTLLKDTKFFADRERELTTKVLHHIREIDRRKLYSDLGYPSLFSYCVKELCYAEASAQRRIQAARLLSQLPELEKKIESGALSLTNLAQVESFFKQNEVTEPEEKKVVIEMIEDLSKKDCEKMLFELSGKEVPTKETSKRISADKTRMTIVVSDETKKKIEQLQNLLGKNLSMDQLISLMADEAIKNTEKKKFKMKSEPERDSKKKTPLKNTKPRPSERAPASPTPQPSKGAPASPTPQPSVNTPASPTPPAEASRVIPAALRRQVYTRDKSCRNCRSTHNLHIDHIKPFTLGGETTLENLRVLCFSCNQRSRMRAKL